MTTHRCLALVLCWLAALEAPALAAGAFAMSNGAADPIKLTEKTGAAIPPLSATGKCTYYADGTAHVLYESCNGGAYHAIASGPTPTLNLIEGAAPALSGAGMCVLYADNALHTVEQSCNGGAYSPYVTVVSGDLRYLKLDSTNDPITGTTSWNTAGGTDLAISEDTIDRASNNPETLLITNSGAGVLTATIDNVVVPGTAMVGTTTLPATATLEVYSPKAAVGDQFRVVDGTTTGYFSVSEGSAAVGGYSPTFTGRSMGINGLGVLVQGAIPAGNDAPVAGIAAVVLQGARDTGVGFNTTAANVLSVANFGVEYMQVGPTGTVTTKGAGGVVVNSAGGTDLTITESGLDRASAGTETLAVQNSGAGVTSMTVDGNIGIAGAAATVPVTVGHCTSNDCSRFGTFGIQSVAVNNGFLQDNVYWNGANMVYRENGLGFMEQFNGGGLLLRTIPAGLAAAVATPVTRMEITAAGVVTDYTSTDLQGTVVNSSGNNSGFLDFNDGATWDTTLSADGAAHTFTTSMGAGAGTYRFNKYLVTTGSPGAVLVTSQQIGTASAATGTTWQASASTGYAPLTGNVSELAFTYGTTTGTNVGVAGTANNGSLNIGTLGTATVTKAGSTNIGVAGIGRDTTGTVQIGGFFSLGGEAASPETWGASAALVADNDDQAVNIISGRHNTSEVWALGHTGDSTLLGDYLAQLAAYPSVTIHETGTFSPGSGQSHNGYGMVVTSDGLPLYVLKDNTTINARKCNDADCHTPSTVAVDTLVGSYGTSVCLLSSGLPFIVYNKGTDLYVAKCNDINCSVPTTAQLATANDDGRTPTCAGYSNGKVALVYGNATTSSTDYRLCSDPTAASPCTTVGAVVSLGYYNAASEYRSDVKVVGNQTPLAVMSGNPDTNLVVVNCSTETCGALTTTSLAPGGRFIYEDTQLAVRASGFATVSASSNGGNLYVYTCTNYACTASSLLSIPTSVATQPFAIGIGLDDVPFWWTHISSRTAYLACTDSNCTGYYPPVNTVTATNCSNPHIGSQTTVSSDRWGLCGLGSSQYVVTHISYSTPTMIGTDVCSSTTKCANGYFNGDLLARSLTAQYVIHSGLSVDVPSATNGTVWYNSLLGRLRVQLGSAAWNILTDNTLVETAISIPDSGTGAHATYTLTPTYHATYGVTCLDADGCDITIAETSASTGYRVNLFNNSPANIVYVLRIAGQVETPGDADVSLGTDDSVGFEYGNSTWRYYIGANVH